MKIYFLSVVLLFATAAVSAQNYKPYKIGFGLGYASPSDGGGGVLIDFEPAYRINDLIAVGIRFESAAMARGFAEYQGSVTANGSYTLNGQYYFTNSEIRAYGGIGLGLFSLASASTNIVSAGQASSKEFGFYPRLGVDFGHFNLNLDYNIIPNSKIEGEDLNGDPATYEIKNSYLGIRLGAFLFGGKN